MPLEPARARRRAILEEAGETMNPLHLPPLDGAGPGRAIGDIIFELVKAAMAYAAGRPRLCKARLKSASDALTILRVQLDRQDGPQRLGRVR